MATPFVLEAHYIAVQKYYMLASVALLCYDLVTTFDIEIARVWSGGFSPFIVLWTLNRWLPVLGYTFVVWLAHSPGIGTDRCNELVMLVPSMQIISYTVIALIVILRTWAIYGRRLWTVLLLGSVYIVALVVQTYVTATSATNISMPPGVTGCLLGATPESGPRFLLFWVVALAFDTVLFGLTLFKTFSLRSNGLKAPLISLLMRDGIIYYLVMFLANVMNVILFLTAPPQLKGMNTYFSHITTVIMISHIMLNLRMYSRRQGIATSENLSKPILGMGSSYMPDSMGIRSARMLTVISTPLTPYSHYSQQPRSMLTETLERFGTPMIENGEELDGDYQEAIDPPMYSPEDLHSFSGSVRPDRQRVASITLASLNQAPPREVDFPVSAKLPRSGQPNANIPLYLDEI